MKYAWSLHARDSQLPPEGDWDTWLILAGRGFGKTRTGAEWVRAQVEDGHAHRIALVARYPPRSTVHHDRGRVRTPQHLPALEQANLRTLQAQAHMAQRSLRTRILKPRAGPAQRPTVRRRLVRRTRIMGVPGRRPGTTSTSPSDSDDTPDPSSPQLPSQ